MDWFEWEKIIKSAMLQCSTPMYIFAFNPLFNRINYLNSFPKTSIPFKQFYSFKTTPFIPIVSKWISAGYPVEVVSKYEYLAVKKLGTAPNFVLINGPRKVDWLHEVEDGAWVHIDSLNEALFLSNHSVNFKKYKYGLRIAVKNMTDPDDNAFSGQFGIPWDDLPTILYEFKKNNLSLESVHFHLKSNVSAIDEYFASIKEIAEGCRKYNWFPCFIDIGGGIPSEYELDRLGTHNLFDMHLFYEAINNCVEKEMPWIKEVWTEHGRFMTADSAVFITAVRDIKYIRGCRYLICDGGRVNNALVSEWDKHHVNIIPDRRSNDVLTSICGPTCMAWDWLERGGFPSDIVIGDLIVWRDAGAYHIPFETSFSHPYASLVWFDGKDTQVVRESQSFDDWYHNLGG